MVGDQATTHPLFEPPHIRFFLIDQTG